jgi:hypothetical protein
MPAWNTREKRHEIVRFPLPSFDCEQIERDSFIRDFDEEDTTWLNAIHSFVILTPKDTTSIQQDLS